MLNVIAPSFTGELKKKKKSHSEPKYSFEELSGEEETAGKITSMCICSVVAAWLTSSKIDGGVVNSIRQSYFHCTMF